MAGTPSERPLQNRVVLVTGAARGIGLGIATALARAGADVVVSDLGGEGNGGSYAPAGAKELQDATATVAAAGPGRAVAVPCDVTCPDQVTNLVEKARAEFGRIDLVVNNAGVVHLRPIDEIDPERWDQVYGVNVKGVFLVSKATLPSLVETQGSIVNIASVAGKRGYANGTLYCSSKFAVVGFTQALALETAASGVRVNAICPGIVDSAMWTEHITPSADGDRTGYERAVQAMVPLGREQSPDDVSGAVLYLATAPSVTGIALNVAGGMEVW